jgi:hypothetical protein
MVEMTKRKRRRSIPEDAIEKPDVPIRKEIQQVEKVKCPWCGSMKVWKRNEVGKVLYYQCRKCVDHETEDWTTFKVLLSQ